MALTDVTHATLLVDDQDEALEYYTEVLGFEVREDSEMPGGDGRWLVVGLPDGAGVSFALVEADTAEKRERVGSQVGDHVAFVFETDDCEATCETLADRGVAFTTGPEPVPWGVHAVFEDRYGNVFNVVEPGEFEGEFDG